MWALTEDNEDLKKRLAHLMAENGTLDSHYHLFGLGYTDPRHKTQASDLPASTQCL